MKLVCTLLILFTCILLSQSAPTDTTLLSTNQGIISVTKNLASYTTEELFIGVSCNDTCSEELINVECNEITKTCECKEDYPILLAKRNGCTKPLQLGEQCKYYESCASNDIYSTCIQGKHTAFCQCVEGYHEVITHRTIKPHCTRDLISITKDIPAILVAIGGVAILSTLICFVLKLFVGKSQRTQQPAITTRLLSATEIAQVTNSVRHSGRRTRFSRKRSRGVTVPASRATAARAAAILLVSCQLQNDKTLEITSDVTGVPTSKPRSTSRSQVTDHSIQKSFSTRQFKRECDQKMARSRHLSEQQSTSSLNVSTSPGTIKVTVHSMKDPNINNTGSGDDCSAQEE